MLSVCEQEISGHTIKREAMARDLNRARRQINARAACAAARKLQKVCPHPAAYLQQPRPAETIEAHHGTHPRRILLITMSFNLVEEFARAEFMCLSVHSAARVFAPLLARPPLLFRPIFPSIQASCDKHPARARHYGPRCDAPSPRAWPLSPTSCEAPPIAPVSRSHHSERAHLRA